MKISLLIPTSGIFTDDKNWLWWIYWELQKTNEVLLNKCSEDCKAIICMTDSLTSDLEMFHTKYPKIPIITYIWDWFSFIDKTQGNYPAYLELMKKSKEVWTSTKYMVKRMKKEVGINCKVIKPTSVLDEFKGIRTINGNYVLQASRRDPRYKRFELFEQACQELDIPFISCHPNKYSRQEYIKILSGCRLLVVSTYEDANTAFSALEATYIRKPVLLSDIEPHLEEFGDTAAYFKTDDLSSLKAEIIDIYENWDEHWIQHRVMQAYKRIIANHTPEIMAAQINERLKRLF